MERISAEDAREPVAHPLGAEPPGGARIDCYTDPLCCWSWALESVWPSIDRRFGGTIPRRFVLGGMIENWSAYRDPLNDISRPAQMAPLWFAAAQRAQVAINPSVWHRDPPASSFPASLAIKAAAAQGEACGTRYLALVREAVMLRGLNVARPTVLRQLADELATAVAAFDPVRFERDRVGDAAADAFARDLREARGLGIGRFPTLVVRGPSGARMAVGYRDAGALAAILSAVGVHPAAT